MAVNMNYWMNEKIGALEKVKWKFKEDITGYDGLDIINSTKYKSFN